MARFLDIHPVDPQPRLVAQAVDVLRDGGVIAYPTESGYALGSMMENAHGKDLLGQIRRLDKNHQFSLMCSNFSQLGQLVMLSNAQFRAVKSVTPGPYTFILKATGEVPRKLLDPKRKTVGARISDHKLVQALLAELGEAMLTSTLIMPGETEPMTDGWAVKEALDYQVDAVIESGQVGREPTTVIDLTGDEPEILRYGAGDPSPFE